MFYKCRIELRKLKGSSNNFPIDRVRSLYDNIKKYGNQHPILIDEKLNVKLGNTRLTVLKLLQKKDNYLVPCVMYSKNKRSDSMIESNKELEIILAQPTKKIFRLFQK